MTARTKRNGGTWNCCLFKYAAVAVGNFTRQEKEIGLKIDWNALGIKKPQSVCELWTGKDIPVSELGKFKLKGSHFALFGIK